MIGASRRRSALGQRLPAAFDLHVREARMAALHRRLLHAALAALGFAAVALFLPLTTPTRALIVAGAALLGAVFPPRSSLERTLESIRSQTGLSYETAIELAGQPHGAAVLAGTPEPGRMNLPDPYGLHTAVIERAKLAVRGYERPQRPAWWLPALVVAAALVALPELVPVGPSNARGGAATPPQVGSQTGQAGPEQPAEPAPPEPPAPGQVEAPLTPPRPDEERGEEPVTDLPEGDAGGQAPLSRFLQSLRERPAVGDGAPTEGSDSPADGEDARRETEAEREAGEGGENTLGDPSDEPTSGSSSDETANPNTADGGQEQSDQGAEDEAAGEDGSALATDEQQGEAGEQPSAQQPDGGGLEQGGGGEDGAQGLQQGGEDPGAGSDGADSAGLGGADGAEGSLDPQGVAGQPDQLFGVLQDGPENVAGSVRLPGSTEVELPPGTSYAPYRSAAEEALTEGDLPLDYQEIIRRYFQ